MSEEKKITIKSEALFPNGFGFDVQKETFDDPDMFSAYLKEIRKSVRTKLDFSPFIMVHCEIKVEVEQIK